MINATSKIFFFLNKALSYEDTVTELLFNIITYRSIGDKKKKHEKQNIIN